ncbi:MAG: fused MFS/spermidine synthase [Sphingomicrobium sp.]
MARSVGYPVTRAAARRLLFPAAIFAGSFLLFLVQPMIARVALPRLGGAPAVWNSAMVSYQLLLLGGYAYAHWLARHSARSQARLHLALMLVAALFLPIGLSAATLPPGISAFLWVPWLFFSSIGPLFFLISANAPLLQRWFASSGGGDPYPLYAASNLGSFCGLIAYPLLLEPLLPVTAQRLLWSGGYGLLLVLLLGCAWTLGKGERADPVQPEIQRTGLRASLKWVWLAFVPSGLMLATTQFITTDIMPMPLLWVLPLGLYLLSFTVAFASRGRAARLVALIAPYMLVPAAIALFLDDRLLPVIVVIVLIALFAISVACHFKIYQTRPDPKQLTGFYLAIAVGGALGGLFCALVAPLIFDWTYEYPLLLIAAAVTLLPAPWAIVPSRWLERPRVLAAMAGLSVLLVGGALAVAFSAPDNAELAQYGSLAALMIGTFAVGSRLFLTSTMLAAMILGGAWQKLQLSAAPDRMIRTYFGVYSIVDTSQARQLLHGTTLHGVQLLSAGWKRFPTTYYGRESGVGRSLQLAGPMFGPQASVSVVGLGTGTLACYKQPGQRWTFFELDPAVVDLATDSGRFSFVPLCAPDARMVIGDARLELAKEPPGSADVLVVDAFSSDAVPMHLLTKEAFEIYGRHLKPAGLLLVHVSNRHLNLESVVAAVPGWASRFGKFSPSWDHRHEVDSDWIALSRSPATIETLVRLSEESFWRPTTNKTLLWTDDSASLLSVFR